MPKSGDLLGDFAQPSSQPGQPAQVNNNPPSNLLDGDFGGSSNAAQIDPHRKMTLLEKQGSGHVVPDMG